MRLHTAGGRFYGQRVGFTVTTNGAEITFQVEGWPPTKGEAKSMLAAGHSHAERVRLLLQAAGHAAEHQGWVTTAAEIGLELIVRGPTRPTWDRCVLGSSGTR